MEITHNIKLQNESLEYLSKVFNKYTEVEFTTSRIYESPVIHLYPTHDTYGDDGELNGYLDKLFCTIKIYDTINDVFSIVKSKDALDTYHKDVKVYNIGYFKDGSVIIDLTGNYKFGSYQALEVIRVD